MNRFEHIASITYILIRIATKKLLLKNIAKLSGQLYTEPECEKMYEVALGHVNWIGVAFLLLAVLLVLVEIHLAGFGIVGLFGAGCFVFGSIFLVFDSATPLPSSSSTIVTVNLIGLVPIILVTIVVGKWLVSTIVKSGEITSVPAHTALIGTKGYTTKAVDPRGLVLLNNEKWSARSLDNDTIPSGFEVEVIAVHDLTVTVKKVTS
jgi:membrane-bound ClpP family serine protease